MRIIAELEKAQAETYIEIAACAAKNSPCLKSQRGAVIVLDDVVIGAGNNHPPDGSKCKTCLRKEHPEKTYTEPCRALHAEEAALLAAYKNGHAELEEAVMYHIKVKDGKKVRSGKPSCTICAKLILAAGIKEFILWHEEGLTAYTAKENYELSLKSLDND